MRHWYTVVGFWQDNDQRYCEHVLADTPQAAEDLCLEHEPGLAVCAVFAGKLKALDDWDTHINRGSEAA